MSVVSQEEDSEIEGKDEAKNALKGIIRKLDAVIAKKKEVEQEFHKFVMEFFLCFKKQNPDNACYEKETKTSERRKLSADRYSATRKLKQYLIVLEEHMSAIDDNKQNVTNDLNNIQRILVRILTHIISP